MCISKGISWCETYVSTSLKASTGVKLPPSTVQKHIPIYLLVVNRCYCWCKSIYPTHLKIFFGMALYRYSRGRRQVCYPYHYHHDKYIVATITASDGSNNATIITITIMTGYQMLPSWQVCHHYHYHHDTYVVVVTIMVMASMSSLPLPSGRTNCEGKADRKWDKPWLEPSVLVGL